MADAGTAVGADAVHPRWRVIAVQVAAYALLIACSCLQSRANIGAWPQVAAVFVVLTAFLVCWPLRGGVIDRVISALFGVLSTVCPHGARGWWARRPDHRAARR